MKKSVIVCFILICSFAKGQKTTIDSLADFENVHFKEHLSQIKNETEKENYLNSVKRNFIKRKYNLVEGRAFKSSAVATSTCGNVDFEDGNTAGWTIVGDYQIMSGLGSDPYGSFPVVCPGGNFSLRVNDDNTVCAGPNPKLGFISEASRPISITASNYKIKINFAGSTLNFPHPQGASAYIGIRFYDSANNLIPSADYTVMYASPPNSVIATSTTTSNNSLSQGWQICGSGPYPVSYFPWQQQVFDLSAYIGQTVELKLKADWCLYQYDWAYAYFDVCCDSTCPTVVSPTINIQTTNVCVNSTLNSTLCSSTSTNINYNWYGSSGPISTGSCLVTNTQGSYTLQSVSPINTTSIFQEIFNLGLNVPVSFSVSSNNGCSNSSSGITLFVSPSGGVFGGPGISGNVFQPWVVGNGTYILNYIYTNPIGGCVTSSIQTVNVSTCTDVFEKIKNNEFFIAPNPFKSEININCKELPENSEIILFNCIGQEILRKRISEGKNTVDTEGVPQGLYIYSIELQNKPIKQGKLVKD